MKKAISESIINILFFLGIGLLLWQTQGHLFFLFNFLYIGLAASVGELVFGLLPREKKEIKCGLCEQHCPMDIQLLSYMHRDQRIRSTECIACQQCVNICPENAVRYSKIFDPGFKEYLNLRRSNFPP